MEKINKKLLQLIRKARKGRCFYLAVNSGRGGTRDKYQLGGWEQRQEERTVVNELDGIINSFQNFEENMNADHKKRKRMKRCSISIYGKRAFG